MYMQVYRLNEGGVADSAGRNEAYDLRQFRLWSFVIRPLNSEDPSYLTSSPARSPAKSKLSCFVPASPNAPSSMKQLLHLGRLAAAVQFDECDLQFFTMAESNAVTSSSAR